MSLMIVFMLAISFPCSFADLEAIGLPSRLESCYLKLFQDPENAGANALPEEVLDFYCTAIYNHPSGPVYSSVGNVTTQMRRWMTSLLFKHGTVPGYGVLRVRKEYRRLSAQERRNYHLAINLLKRDTSVTPNKFDAFAIFHSGIVTPIGHGGANFLPWHRIYLLMYENALRENIASVTLPYWDSTLDVNRGSPEQSTLWSRHFLGNGDGLVTSGPFANWITPSGLLIRNVNPPSESIWSKEQIDLVMSKKYLEDISVPVAGAPFNYEIIHGQNHRWVGGNFRSLQTAAQDPIFYLHHAFVDYNWHVFRKLQKQRGVNPARDYPGNYGTELHAPDAPTNFGPLRTADAITDAFEKYIVTYEDSPTCSRLKPRCGSRYLTCLRRSYGSYRCAATISNSKTCPKPTAPVIQNNFRINRKIDYRDWVYIPVEVIYRRPNSPPLKAYPITGNTADKTRDIYQPPRRSDDNTGRCSRRNNVISIRADGLSYSGYFKEYAIIDDRLSISHAYSCIGVRRPDADASFFAIRAFDACGNMCQMSCRVPGSNPPSYSTCPGTFSLTTSRPVLYRDTVHQCLNSVLGGRDRTLPRPLNNVDVLFSCGYIPTPDTKSFNAIMVGLSPTRVPTRGAQSIMRMSDRLMRAIPPAWRNSCCIAPGCVVNYPCTGCRQTGNVPCNEDKSLYGTCVRGRFEIRACARGTYFDNEARECGNANAWSAQIYVAGTAGSGSLTGTRGGRPTVGGRVVRGRQPTQLIIL